MNKVREKKQDQDPEAAAPKATATSKTRLPKGFINVLNGSFLTRENVIRNMPFILFCAGLMIIYIAYGYQTERIVRQLDRTGSELKELRSEYITVRSQLEKKEQQSQVASGIGALGLEESVVPPVKITVDQDGSGNTRGR